jgi:dihydroflavonol-4-reductase
MILVTGGTGFIGRHLLERLSAENIPAKALIRRPWNASFHSVRLVRGDIATGEGLAEAVEGVDSVIHLAGVTKALRPDDYYRGNVIATERLAGMLAGRPIRLVHVSSLAALGPNPDSRPLDEDADPHPFTHYGKSKLESERVVRRALPDAVIVRPPVVYGPRDTDVFQLLRSIARGLVVEIAGGERWFSAIFVRDLVDGLLAAARTPDAAGRTYFLAHSKPLSWSEFSAAAAGIMHRHPRTVRVPPAVANAAGFCAELWARAKRKPGIVSREKVAEARCTFWTCDTRRAAAELGFRAQTSIEAGLAETLAWYREARWLAY